MKFRKKHTANVLDTLLKQSLMIMTYTADLCCHGDEVVPFCTVQSKCLSIKCACDSLKYTFGALNEIIQRFICNNSDCEGIKFPCLLFYE